MKIYEYLEPQAVAAYRESGNEETTVTLSIALSLKRIADSLERQGELAMTRRDK